MTDELTNWDYDEMVPFKEEFLSGFRTEIYQIDLKKGFEYAKDIMRDKIESAIRKEIGDQYQHITAYKIKFNNVTYKYILLPIWISSYRYKDQTYMFIINGQSGQISGSYPKSNIDKIILVIFIAVIVALIYFFELY